MSERDEIRASRSRRILVRRLCQRLVYCALASAAAASHAASTPGSVPSDPEASGFSIETEMLTYRALESNSEAIACDTAAYIYGSSVHFARGEGSSYCDLRTSANGSVVLIMPFDTNEFRDFQIWRADMATMARLDDHSNTECPVASEIVAEKGRGAATSSAPTTSKSVLSAALGATPAGPALAIAQSVLAAMASNEASSSVGGTIHDQALMDGIARNLQGLNVSVLMPDAYTPSSLSSLDKSNSPFLASVDRLLTDRARCLQDLETSENTGNRQSAPANGSSKTTRITQMIADINDFFTTLADKSTAASKTPSSTNASAPGGAPSAKSTNAPQSAGAAAEPASSSHLSAVLLADGLAARLGVSVSKGTLAPDKEAQIHVLLVQALESGGSVTRFSNLLGTRIRYSGGSVATYSLFTMKGDMECSGNVFEYGGALDAKDFQDGLRRYVPDPSKQTLFMGPGCHRPPVNR